MRDAVSSLAPRASSLCIRAALLTLRHSFLPYTISFSTSTEADHRHSSSNASPPRLPHAPSADAAPAAPATLFRRNTPPRTPEEHVGIDGLFLQLRASSPAVHFPRPHDPRTIARTDAHVPEWGRSRIFNQPRSRATNVPPSGILAYAQAHTDRMHERLGRIDGRTSPRDPSREDGFPQSDFTVEPAIQGNGGLTNAIRDAKDKGELGDVLWVGTLGFPTDALSDQQKGAVIDELENDWESLSVIVKDDDFDGHYNRYCKTILWDSLNYQVPDHPRSKAYEDHSWVYYVKVNQAFADRVIQDYKHGDTIWVHDYHLMLVPGIIRKKLPDARIGFFLHTSFPSSEVFRCLAMRTSLLEGILGANLVAFQAPEYANHFLQTCSRILVVEATENGVQLEDRVVEVTSVPMGVCLDQMSVARREQEVVQWTQTIRNKYKDKLLIVGRDKLDSIRGIKQKLLAYEIFLQSASEELREKVVLIQVATSVSKENKDVDAAISAITTRINSRYSTLAHQPLVFLKQDIAFSQYLALLTVADILMVTPLRDGMNLTCHEFLLCQDGLGGGTQKHGPLILSEFTGSASLFTEKGGELQVNPWDYHQMARAIQQGLVMEAEEKRARHHRLLRVVRANDSVSWVQRLREHLVAAYERHQFRDTMSVPRLSISQLSARYSRAINRLFILDYEGTLTPRTIRQSPQRVVDTLADLLTSSESNVVYVASSRTCNELDAIFKQVPNLGLIAENGCFVRAHDSLEWVDLADSERAAQAKKGIRPVLQYYLERLEGSWIEEKACGFIFHYEKAEDREAADRQGGECANHVADACRDQRMKAVPGDKCILIESLDASKVAASKWVLRSVKATLEGVTPPDRAPSHQPEAFKLELPTRRKSSRADRRPVVHALEPVDAEAAVTSPGGGYFKSAPLESLKEMSVCSSKADGEECEPTKRSRTGAGQSSFSEDGRAGQARLSMSEDKERAGPVRPSIDEDAMSRQSSKAIAAPTTFPDFLFVAGDDRDDEAVFHWANELGVSKEVANVISVCVGKRNTEASCTLTQGATGLVTALQKLSRS